MNISKLVLGLSVVAGIGVGCAVPSLAQEKGMDNARRAPYLSAVKDKKVVFVPMSMGFDLTEAWAAQMKSQAARLGYNFQIRDPNWNVDAGSRAIQDIITEGADIIVAHNPDIQSYGRLLQRAEAAGIKVIQVNMEASAQTDSYVGADWVEIGETAGRKLVEKCGPGKGSSTKIAIVQGVPTSAADVYQMRGIHNILDKHPEIKLVSQQGAAFDPSKARAIMATVLQQHPDLCGAFGVWDSADVGTGSAVQEAGKSGQVYVITSGGGSRTACENIKKGLFSMEISYNAPLIGHVLNSQIAELLQSKDKPGARKTTYFTPLTLITKENANDFNCWSMDELK